MLDEKSSKSESTVVYNDNEEGDESDGANPETQRKLLLKTNPLIEYNPE